MRRLGALAIFVALALAIAAPGMPAAAGEKVKARGTGDSMEFAAERATSTPPAASSSTGPRVTTTSSGPARPAPPKPDWRDDRIVYTHANGAELHYVFNDVPGMDFCRGSSERVTCYGPEPERPERRPNRNAPPPPISPSEIVQRTIVEVQLPQPEPNVDPGYAVTGLRSYLETGNSTTHTFPPIATVLGPLSITATSTYTVDWGDGTVTGPHASSGGKYPNGDITHVYQRTGVVDITVTQNWTASWSLAGQSGSITGLSSSGTLDDFAVNEVQASRRR